MRSDGALSTWGRAGAAGASEEVMGGGRARRGKDLSVPAGGGTPIEFMA
jgi:hypothetical protein